MLDAEHNLVSVKTSNWSSLRLNKIATDINVLSSGPKAQKKCREFMTPFAPREICKTPHSMYARMPQAMAQFVPNLKKKCLISKGQPQYYKQLEI